jgi:hypothetical protein
MLLAALLSGCVPELPRIEEPKELTQASLAIFTVNEHLGHRASDELVHFDFDVATSAAKFVLLDAQGAVLPSQISGLVRNGSRLKGRIWTLLSLEPKGAVRLSLHAQGRRDSHAASAGFEAASDAVSIREEHGRVVVSNDRIAVALPRWPGVLAELTDLTTLPAPLESVRTNGGKWLGDARWVNEGSTLRAREASTRVLERGPVRAVIEQKLTFSDGRSYEATLTLVARQDAALIAEHSDVDEPKAALRLSMQAGLGADHVYWHSQWNSGEGHERWTLFDTAARFDREHVVCKMRPWSFWWLPDLAEWAGFYRKGHDPFVGVLLLRPSRWSPEGASGFNRTEVPVTARSGGGLDLTFPLAAGKVQLAAGRVEDRPLHREWALTAGSVSEHVVSDGSKAKLRHQLIKYGEFPLDETKDYGFDYASPQSGPAAPRLFFDPDLVARARRLAITDPDVKAEVRRGIQAIEDCGGLAATLDREGPDAFYNRYRFHQLQFALPKAYLGASDPQYGRFMAAAVKGLAGTVVDTFLKAPARPALGAYGPWFSETITRLVLNYDLIAGTGLLTAEEEIGLRPILVFAAHVLAHPDYWNVARGLNSANPNMTSAIILPKGLLGLALRGHPEGDIWLRDAEAELAEELADWVSPGGAWVESPAYQVSSFDGMFLFAQALRNVTGRDAFVNPRFKETLEYFGFLLTPPDGRFPPQKKAGALSPMVLPSVGHGFAGTITPFNGWMAAATTHTDPSYSARQQFFWERQGHPYETANRATGMVLAVTDPTLPTSPPAETSRAFPDFGSVMRSSWTDSNASYLVHRTGPNGHHYDDDQGSFVYYAKGAPLCLDWGNYYQPLLRSESFYHNRVSFDKRDSPAHFGTVGKLVALRSLPKTLDYSQGETAGGGGQRAFRHILLIKSPAALGANYVVVRDLTREAVPGQSFYWNLWCLSRSVEIGKSLVHFPGQLGVDLDVHVVSPVAPRIEQDHWGWKQTISLWGDFAEEQFGMRIAKDGSAEDFFVVLHPRAAEQRRARVDKLAGGTGMRIAHEEGTDYILFSPDTQARVERDDAQLRGEIAFARRYTSGEIRLAVVQGADASASLGGITLTSDGPVAIERTRKAISGESSGGAHRAVITLPGSYPTKGATLDDRPLPVTVDGRSLTFELPPGMHRFAIALE